MHYPPLHRLALEKGVRRRKEPTGPTGVEPSPPARLNEEEWTTLRAMLEQSEMDGWTAAECRDPARKCMASKDFNLQWCKDPRFWFWLCQKFRWSVNVTRAGEAPVARPRVFNTSTIPIAGGSTWSFGVDGSPEPVPDARVRMPVAETDNEAALETYYRTQRAKLETMLAEPGADRAALLAMQRGNYREACIGVDETTLTHGAVVSLDRVVRFNPDPERRGPFNLSESGGSAIVTSSLATLRYAGDLQVAIATEGFVNGRLRYKGSVDPGTGLAHGYGTLYLWKAEALANRLGVTESEVAVGLAEAAEDPALKPLPAELEPVYEGMWCDGEFHGPGKLYTHRRWEIFPPGPGGVPAMIEPSAAKLWYEGNYKNGLKHGRGTQYAFMLPAVRDSVWLQNTPALTHDWKAYEGEWTDGVALGEGKSYYALTLPFPLTDPALASEEERDAFFRRAPRAKAQLENLQRGKDAKEYEGTWVLGNSGTRMVWGKQWARDGDLRYRGEFQRDKKREGYGTSYYRSPYNKMKDYNGTWQDGKRHGAGTAYYRSGVVWISGGRWNRDFLQGEATVYYPSGKKEYEARFAGSLLVAGKRYRDDAENTLEYDGEWESRNWIWTIGTFGMIEPNSVAARRPQRNGQGRGYYPDGSVYEGPWKRNQRKGKGKMTYADGSVYEGYWDLDKRYGMGKLYRPDGSLEFHGEWWDDKPQQSAT